MIQREDSKTFSPPREILVAEGLRKSYGPRRALQGLTFSLKAGRILGFLGPNGAGKTTSIRILTTMMEPEAGHFTIDGIGSEHPEQIRRRIGVLPENLRFPRQMTKDWHCARPVQRSGGRLPRRTYFRARPKRTTGAARTSAAEGARAKH